MHLNMKPRLTTTDRVILAHAYAVIALGLLGAIVALLLEVNHALHINW